VSDHNLIIFFDGVCGLCNRWVDFVFRIDSTGKIKVSPLQGELAKTKLQPDQLSDLSTIVFCKKDKRFTRSTAILEILREVGGIWSLSVIFYLFPRLLRDWIYDLIASNRYKLFGKRESCRLPTPEEKERFV